MLKLDRATDQVLFKSQKSDSESNIDKDTKYLLNYLRLQQVSRYTSALDLMLVSTHGLPISLISQLELLLVHPVFKSLQKESNTSAFLEIAYSVLQQFIIILPDFIWTECQQQIIVRHGEHLKWIWQSRGWSIVSVGIRILLSTSCWLSEILRNMEQPRFSLLSGWW